MPADGADAVTARPFAAALIYPVVTMAVPGTHMVSRELLLGSNPQPSQVARRSAELHVGENEFSACIQVLRKEPKDLRFETLANAVAVVAIVDLEGVADPQPCQ